MGMGSGKLGYSGEHLGFGLSGELPGVTLDPPSTSLSQPNITVTPETISGSSGTPRDFGLSGEFPEFTSVVPAISR